MSDVGLRRSHQQRTVGVSAGAVGRGGGLGLDRIPQRGARSVGLEVVHVPACQTGPRQRGVDEPLLGATVGHRQTAGRAVLVDRAAGDDRADPIAVALRIAEPLEDENPAAFTAHVTIGGCVEGFAPPDGGEHPGSGGGDGGDRAKQDVDPAGQRQIAVTGVQCLAGLMHGHQRGTTGGIDRHGRSFEPERERHPTGDGVQCVAGDEVGGDLVDRFRRQQVRVLVGRYPHEDAGSAAAQRRRGQPGALQTLPDGLEHQPLLWLDPDSLAWGDTEELRIEPVDSVQESAESAVDLARGVGIRVVELVDVEAILGNLADRIDTPGQQLPERFRVGSSGEPA